MKRSLMLAVLLSFQVSANPITDAIKENPWPVFKCEIDVNGKPVKTVTNSTEYNQYTLVQGHQYTSTISDGASLVVYVDGKPSHGFVYTATAIIYKGEYIVSTYPGVCTK